jgi:hypothetical protein
MSLTIQCKWDEFKRMGKEFLDLLPSANLDEVENGYKALGLAYIGMGGSKSELFQSEILFKILTKKKIEHELGLLCIAQNPEGGSA